MSKDSRTGRQWSTGGNTPFREDLVAWPTPAKKDSIAATTTTTTTSAPPTARDGDADLTADELRAELAEARAVIRRLLARIESLEAKERG
jgi:hypothetical protein